MANFFGVLTSIINKKKISEEDIQKQFNSFVAIKWLSNNPGTLLISNYLNSYRGNSNIDNKNGYLFLRNAINLPKNTFIKFDKKSKEDLTIQAIKEKFKVNYYIAAEYLEILPENQIKQIKKIYKGLQ